jgi:membrane-associated HD superfamily phosphohydrolase
MDWMLWIYVITALASALAAVLAWAAKLWWAKEYSAAKDETIKAKEAQIASLKAALETVQALAAETAKAKDAQIETLKDEIQNLRELTPMKLREYFLSVKEQLEEYNGKLQDELKIAYEEIEKKDAEIRRLIEAYPEVWGGSTAPYIHKIPVAKLEALMQDLRATKEQLQMKAESLKQKLQKEEALQQRVDRLLIAAEYSFGVDSASVYRACGVCGTELVSQDNNQTFFCPKCSS